MQRRLAEELRALRFDEDATPSRAGGGRVGYSTSIQRVVAVSAAATSASLVFPSSGSSSASSTSLSSTGSAVATPNSGPESYKLLRMEAFRDLSEIASHMVNDGYTKGLIREFSRCQLCSGGDAILRTWFSELGVDWVLGVDESKLQKEPWSAVEDLIKRWVVGFTVMAEALRLTRPGLCSSDGGAGPPISARLVPRSAPPGGGAARTTSSMSSPVSSSSDSSDLDQQSSDPATRRSFDVATVNVLKEAIIAFSSAEKGRFFGLGGQEGTGPQNQFSLFAEASLMKMLRFPGAVAALTRSPEKILRMIDMYSVVSDAYPDLLALLSGGSKKLVSDRIGSVLQAMSEAVRQILHTLMVLIREEDPWRTAPGSDDDIHPVTRYVLNYINLLLEDRIILDSMLRMVEEESILFLADDNSSLTSVVVDLINSLDAMLEVKSNVYTAAGRRYIFLLNNAYFVLQQAEPALEGFLGTWSAVYRKPQIERYTKGYLDASWGPVTACLAHATSPKQRRNSVFRKVSAMVDFNALLQMTYNTEKFWKINNPQLRSTLRKSVSSKVISAYRAFLGTHALAKTSVIYTPEDLEDLFQDLFEG